MKGKELAEMGASKFQAISAETIFKLEDLVPPDTWSAAPAGVRRHAGKVFLPMMQASPLVECLGPDKENHQRYRRLG